ncbi:unnamed protein product [Linum trigynum]|uniref:Uncharacterized protein n=1 Tax=Linum trigynum TaxID=586398 RepID=A0AAV2FNY4_9ROSI
MGTELPQYVALRSKTDGKYLHYMWNEEEFGEFYKFSGTKKDVDPVSPFAKVEIVPSPGTYGAYIYLRSAYNNKYLIPVKLHGINFLSFSADSPNDDMSLVGVSTRFEPFTPSDMPNTIWFRYAANQTPIYITTNEDDPALDQLACLYSQDRAYRTYFEYAAWESYEDKMKANEQEILSLGKDNEKLKEQVASGDEEVEELKGQVAAKDGEIQSRDKEIQELTDQVAADEGDKVKLKGQVAAWETYEEERKAKLAEEMEKLQSAWESFQSEVTAGADPPKD